MIDLSQFVDKKVRVTFRNGELRDCNIKSHLIRTATYPYIISYVIGDRRNENTYTREGRLDLNTSTSLGDIIKIEELKPMIDLEKFVNKKVIITRNCHGTRVGCLMKGKHNTFPYELHLEKGGIIQYNREGYNLSSNTSNPYNIKHIEELKPMNKYEELENKVAEMQKEIDRLKREEKKENYPNLKPVEVTRTVRFTPEEYFEHCEENGFEPSEEGYVEYCSDAYTLEECFMCREHHTQQIKEVDN